MDAVYDALDTFTRASSLATGVEIEIEAQAEAMIGKILFKLLAKPEKAKRHLYDSVLLANSLYPRVVTEEAWYQLASKHLQEIRDKFFREEQENESAGNKKYYEMIREDLDECKEAKSQGDNEFLEFLNSKFALEIEMTPNFKKVVLRYIQKMHPDKHG